MRSRPTAEARGSALCQELLSTALRPGLAVCIANHALQESDPETPRAQPSPGLWHAWGISWARQHTWAQGPGEEDWVLGGGAGCSQVSEMRTGLEAEGVAKGTRA